MKRVFIALLLPLWLILPYTALFNPFDSSEVKPWRVAASILVVAAPFVIFPARKALARLVIPAGLFISYLVMQPWLFTRERSLEDYIFVAAQVPLVLLPLLAAGLVLVAPRAMFRTLEVSVVLACAYQIYQLLAFYLLEPSWAALLNDRYQVSFIGFYRVIHGVYGPSSFMGEAGQFALFVGPACCALVVMRLTIGNKIWPFTPWLVVFCLALTISFGGLLQIGFVVATLLSGQLVRRRISFTHVFGAVAASAFVYLLVTSNETVSEFFHRRLAEMTAGTSERQTGAVFYKELLSTNPLFGYGFLAYRTAQAQSSHVYSILADHGIVGFLLLLFALLGPCLMAVRKGVPIIIILPSVGAAVHMLVAYGSYQWPGVWLIGGFCFAIGEMARRKKAIAGVQYLSRLRRPSDRTDWRPAGVRGVSAT